MTSNQRRFLVINYWVGTPAGGAFVGPVLVSTLDYHYFHFWDEQDAVMLEPADYEIVRVYRLGWSFAEIAECFKREFQPDPVLERIPPLSIDPFELWGSVERAPWQPCLAV